MIGGLFKLKINIVLILLFFKTCLLHAQVEYVIENDFKYKGNYIGGHVNGDINRDVYYQTSAYNIDHYVRSVSQLIELLASKNSRNKTIYLDDNVVFDLSGCENISLQQGIILCSGRGLNGSKGALVLTNTLKTSPLFSTNGKNVTIRGIRLQGPDQYVVHPTVLEKFLPNKKASDVNSDMIREVDSKTKRQFVYGIGNSRGIEVTHSGVTIENCEIFGWSHAGISIRGGIVDVKYNYIHHNQRYGLGYGIMLNKGKANIIANIFKDNRHSIAGTGDIGTSYKAEYNILLPNIVHQGHQFDMHGGYDRKEKNNIAGDKIEIRNNIILYQNTPSVLIRGNPQKKSSVENNLFVKVKNGNLTTINRQVLSNQTSRLLQGDNNLVRQNHGKLRLVQMNNRHVELD